MKRKQKKKTKSLRGRIVKRRGHLEKFDARKIHRSCYRACVGSHLTRNEAKKICDAVTAAAKRWIRKKHIVTSIQIHKFVAKELRKHNKEVAFMYETHRDVS